MRTTRNTIRRRAAAAAALTAAVAATHALSAQAAGTQLACGATVTADVRLTHDLTGCTGNGLVVGAAGITIDLAGHTVSGDGALTGTSAGIFNEDGHADLTLKGGSIRGFTQGVDVVGAARTRIEDVTLRDNAIGMTLHRTVDTRVERLQARANGSVGIEAFLTEGLLVRNSTLVGSGLGGVVDRSSHGSRYQGILLVRNASFGILLDDSTGVVASGNIARANNGDGFQLGWRTTTARLDGNRAFGNDGNGFSIEEAGNRLTGNVAVANDAVGILAVTGTVDGGRNRASGNAAGDCVNLACG